jgi:hypothetical protein
MLAVGGPRFDLLWRTELRINTGKFIRQTGELQIPQNRTVRHGGDGAHQAECSGGRLCMSEIDPH